MEGVVFRYLFPAEKSLPAAGCILGFDNLTEFLILGNHRFVGKNLDFPFSERHWFVDDKVNVAHLETGVAFRLPFGHKVVMARVATEIVVTKKCWRCVYQEKPIQILF